MATFLQKMNEKGKAKTNEGFAAFRQGKKLYFDFVKKHGEAYGCGKENPSLKQAYDLYTKAEQVAQEENRFNDMATTHVELGKISELLGEYDTSVKHRREAIRLFEGLPELNDLNKECIRDSYMFLAISLYRCGETDEARKTAEIAIDKYRAAKDTYGIRALEELIRRIDSGIAPGSGHESTTDTAWTDRQDTENSTDSEESMVEQMIKDPVTRRAINFWLIIGLLILLYYIFFK